MFCSKCGAKVIEGSAFCEKCGAKLVAGDVGSVAVEIAEEPIQEDMRKPVESLTPDASKVMEQGKLETSKSEKLETSEMPKFSESPVQVTLEMGNLFEPVSAGDIYGLLQERASNCPDIKKVAFLQRQGITRLVGKKNQYFIGFSRGEYRLTAYPAFLFSIPRIILLFAYCFILLLLFAELDFEEIYFLPGWLLILGGVPGAIVSSVICRREKRRIETFIKETLLKAVCIEKSVAHIIEPIPMMLSPHLMFLGLPLHVASIIEPIVCAVAALAGAVMLTVGSGILDNTGSSGYDKAGYDSYSNVAETETHISPSEADNTSLSNTYTNETEGFSFMYPYDWEMENVDEIDPNALVSIACTGMYGTYARIAVWKEVDDGSYFAAAKSDFEDVYSSTEGFSNVEVMDLSNIEMDGYPARKLMLAFNNVNGTRLTLIQYFYVWKSYVYTVSCYVEEINYDSFESRINAIMDSYTIMAQEQQEGWGDSMEGNLVYDEIETYEISGAYAGIWENSTASVSMYSSGEEDDGVVGNISLCLDSRMPAYGGALIEGQLVRQDVNLFCIPYEDVEVLLNVGRNNAGDIMIDLYIDGEFIESFTMTEQYIS